MPIRRIALGPIARARIPIIAVLLALAAADCHDAPTAPRSVLRSLPRPLTASETRIIASNNAFAFSLFRAVNDASPQRDSNLFISPLSASMALAMTTNGAAGATLDSMRTALGVGDARLEEMDAAYRSLIDLLRSLDASVDLRIANSIWYRQEVPFTPAFLDLTRRYFDAEVAAKDFDSPRTADDINAWAARSTNGKIPRIVDFIPSEMVMYLVNAIYFKGGWVQRFEPSATKVEPFTLASGAVVTAPLMHLEHSLPYAETATYQAVDLAYGRSAYSMTVLSPKAGTSVAALAAALDGDAWTSLARQFDRGDSTRVALALPKFRLTWGDSLNVPLKSLGMRIAFTRDTADFTGMAPVPLGRKLYISRVDQKTFVDVNEEGTEAAAATSVGVAGTTAVDGGPKVMRVDHPFIFAIRERLSGTVLFIGTVMRPPTS